MKKNTDRGISRVEWQTEKGVAQGWQVRVQRQGTIQRRFFNDKKYGGKTRSLAAARVYRDRTGEEALAALEMSLGDGFRKAKASDQMGVCRVKSRCRKDSGVYRYDYWQALWSPKPGERKCRRFSIRKYGEKRAFELALSARREATREIRETRFY